MEIGAREIEGILFIDLLGPYPEKYRDETDIEKRFREVLADHDDFVIVLHQSEFVEVKQLVFLLKWLHAAGRPIGALGLGPYVKIVTDSDRVFQILNVVDSSFRIYSTEEEALENSA